MTQNPNAHEPALLPQEAAMLPAVAAGNRSPGRLWMPGNPADFRPVPAEEADTPQRDTRVNLIMPRREEDFRTVESPREEPWVIRQGSAAGRAILHAAGVSLPGPGSAGSTGVRRRIRIFDGTPERYLDT